MTIELTRRDVLRRGARAAAAGSVIAAGGGVAVYARGHADDPTIAMAAERDGGRTVLRFDHREENPVEGGRRRPLLGSAR